VEKSDNRTTEYFSLANGHFRHDPKPFANIADWKRRSCILEETEDAFYREAEDANGNKQGESENELFYHGRPISP
jgi:hypothetical protein